MIIDEMSMVGRREEGQIDPVIKMRHLSAYLFRSSRHHSISLTVGTNLFPLVLWSLVLGW